MSILPAGVRSPCHRVRPAVRLLAAVLLAVAAPGAGGLWPAGGAALAAAVRPLGDSDALPPVPAGEPVLTVESGGRSEALTYADIERLPMWETTLETPWLPKATWQGVSLLELLDRYGLGKARTVVMTALDGYAIRLDRAAIEAGNPLLATRRDGAPVPVGQRGPLMVLWPQSAEAVKAGSAASANWIWSLSSIRSGDGGDTP